MNRLTPAKVSMLMFAVVAVLTGAYIAKKVFAVDSRPQSTTRNIPMAVANIPAGTIITGEHIGLGPFPVADMDADILLSDRVVLGRVTRESIPAASPLRAGQFYQPGEKPPLDVGPGMQAVAVTLANGSDIIDGLIKPGQFVDVHMTVVDLGNDSPYRGGVTFTLFQGVRLIAVNRNYQQDAVTDSGNSVVLEMTPAQTNVMILANRRGEITLTYNPNGRGNGGLTVAREDRATLAEILGMSPPTPPEAPFVTESFQQAGRDTHYFQDGRRIDGPRTNDATLRAPARKVPASNPIPASPNSDGTGPNTPVGTTEPTA